MYSVWTKHIKDIEEKNIYRDSLLKGKWVLNRLDSILVEMQEDLNDLETSTKQYDNTNWSFRQADNNGFRRCLKAIRKLIDLDQKENNDRNITHHNA